MSGVGCGNGYAAPPDGWGGIRCRLIGVPTVPLEPMHGDHTGISSFQLAMTTHFLPSGVSPAFAKTARWLCWLGPGISSKCMESRENAFNWARAALPLLGSIVPLSSGDGVCPTIPV